MEKWLFVTSIHYLVCFFMLTVSLLSDHFNMLLFAFFFFLWKKFVVFYTCFHSIAWMLFIPLVPHPYPIIYPTSWSTSPLNPRWVTFIKVDSVILASCCQECGVYFMYSLNETDLLFVYIKSFKVNINCSDSRCIDKEIQW